MPTLEEAKSWYDPNDPVHGFDHVQRVLHMAEYLGQELGADLEIIRAAALLHDAAGAHPQSQVPREQHEYASAEFGRQVLQEEGWPQERIDAVLHCILAHRYRGNLTPRTLEAKILFDADKLDVIGAFGIARTIGYAVQAGLPIYQAPSKKFLEKGETEPNEAHSAYHEHLRKLRHVKDRLMTEPARAIGERRYLLLRDFFEQLAVEASCDVPDRASG
jgi:uncharacterized protein